MKSLYLHEIIRVIDGELITKNSNLLMKNVVKRTRNLDDHTLYFHLYKSREISLEDFTKYEATAIVTEDPNCFKTSQDDVAVVLVEDIDEAYWKFVEYYRSLYEIPIIGVTGTSGKTTTKEMIKHILSEKLSVKATYKSWNASWNGSCK